MISIASAWVIFLVLIPLISIIWSPIYWDKNGLKIIYKRFSKQRKKDSVYQKETLKLSNICIKKLFIATNRIQKNKIDWKSLCTTQYCSWSCLPANRRKVPKLDFPFVLLTMFEHLIRVKIKLWYFLRLYETIWPCWWNHTKHKIY